MNPNTWDSGRHFNKNVQLNGLVDACTKKSPIEGRRHFGSNSKVLPTPSGYTHKHLDLDPHQKHLI